MLGWIEVTAPRELLCLRAEVVDDYSTPVQGPSAPLLWYRIIASSHLDCSEHYEPYSIRTIGDSRDPRLLGRLDVHIGAVGR
jgi:hypothetical protein